MTAPAIIRKLASEIARGITTEAQAVYLLVEVRKLLEQYELKKQYKYLTFHCDWVVHVKLSGPTAQEILAHFDTAHVQLRQGIKLRDLPPDLGEEISRISEMSYFEHELDEFLQTYGLPTLEMSRPDGWTHFLHLYAQVVEDCPLRMTPKAEQASIASVTVHMERAKELVGKEQLYQVTWNILDKNGQSGSIFVINSFSQPEENPPAETNV